MDAVMGILKKWWGKAIAALLTAATTMLISNGILSPEWAMTVAAIVGPLLLSFGEAVIAWILKRKLRSLTPEVQQIVLDKMVEAERIFGSGTGPQKKEWVINELVKLWEVGGFDIPWVPLTGEVLFIRRILTLGIERAMPWFLDQMSKLPKGAKVKTL